MNIAFFTIKFIYLELSQQDEVPHAIVEAKCSKLKELELPGGFWSLSFHISTNTLSIENIKNIFCSE
jgi:hypothetical protein